MERTKQTSIYYSIIILCRHLCFFPPAIFVKEEDIGTYTVKAVDDPRTLNKILYISPPANILSHNELVSLWEKKVGKTFERVYIPEEEVLKKIQGKEVNLLMLYLRVSF